MAKKRHQNRGLRKICTHPRQQWPKCACPWHFSYKWNGTHYRFSLNRKLDQEFDSKTAAEDAAEELRVKIREGTFGSTLPVRATLTLRQLLDTYEREHLKLRPGGTKVNERSLINMIATADLTLPTGEVRPFGAWLVDDIGSGTLEQFRRVRQVPMKREGKGSRTIGGPVGVNRALSFLRRVYNWSIANEYLDATPFKRHGQTIVKLPKEPGRTRRLDEGEGDRLLAACGPHLRAVVECALETGMRRGEILGLQWSHVQGRELRLPASMTKTRTGRTVPVSGRLAAILAMRRDGPDGEPHPATAYVFGTEIGTKVDSFDTAWETAVLRAHGVEPQWEKAKGELTTACRQKLQEINLHFHDLRREAGSRWLDAGVPIQVVRDWLGHTNVAQTSTYLATTAKTSADAMRRFDEHRLQQLATKGGKRGRKSTPHAKQPNENTKKNIKRHELH